VFEIYLDDILLILSIRCRPFYIAVIEEVFLFRYDFGIR